MTKPSSYSTGDSKCIPWKSLQNLILAHPDTK
ncbi:hypothetical protein Gogos_003627 [Gossypium gossypioides]|uniref:Uncharacterized protein n=1 Tax=Gossypium gossypioides TaxID=34282 RepID=A0A7J9CMM4_GOSGO|nr:hypothetical protein [Gossypium gossypioides]